MFVVQKEGGYGASLLAVRSPTPIETERLQGFPDNRTLVPRKNRMMSDTQRFKQTGNAVTVNVIAHIFSFLKIHLDRAEKGYQSSNLSSSFVTPLVVSKKRKPKKKVLTKKGYISYYTTPKKKGLSLESQRAIISHFAKFDNATIEKEFINDGNNAILKQAVAYAQKHQITFVIATLDCLADDLDLILSTKKKLGNLFESCDLMANDSLTISIAYQYNQRNKLLSSIKTKAAFEAKKKQGQIFGNAQNLTAKGRQMGLEKIRSKTAFDKQQQKVLAIIHKCRKEGMGWGKIAKILNEFGFRTKHENLFYKMSVKRLKKSFDEDLTNM